MSVTLYASIRERRPEADGPAREVSGQGEDYAAAKTAVDAQVPPTWQVLGYSRWSGEGQH